MGISNLAVSDTVAAGDSFPFLSTANGDDRRVSASLLAAYLATLITNTDNKVTTYASPSATGFTVILPDNSFSKWLILTPVAGYAAGAITLPAVGNCVDKQEIRVNCTQSVTTLTINANGSTVTGAPTTLAANGFFLLRFDALNKVFYRVG